MLMVRRTLELLSRGVVLRRRLPPRLGSSCLYVSPEASLRLWKRDVVATDPLLVDLASELVARDSCVWDIGANVGLFAFSSAHLAGRAGFVLAVEADPWLAVLLRRTASELAPDKASVEVLEVAVAGSSGTAVFSLARRSRAANHLRGVGGSSQAGGVRSEVEVQTRSLDDLLASRRAPDVVKIDVEGAEVLCLRGASRLLHEVRPVILCEVAAENCDAVGEMLREASYSIVDAAIAVDQRVPLASAPWNTLAIPRQLEPVE
jgi:FkbM family methyltransferase